ncbi:non-ribosomal peptide synthetase [Streptomyces sp. FXJ1.172]|uniref:non-ribosomal peptide synthetase n=1 Tax=Streptomyces sp. FXJ1.172 TaxID=710705 RepID=UPI0007CFB238|nr:non-ribosomal peptide synthetase [Streptomyces sp. FXJ1.172]WEO95418.1 non-ribosomal peptide synthetase [Streptomyces sp. FXJ1.172]
MLERVHLAIAAHADERPDAKALGSSGRWLTYRELDDLVASAAGQLSAAVGPGAERPVAVITGRSEWAVVAMLATWRADCVYVPLSEGTPPERLAQILGRVRPAALLTDRAAAERLRQTWSECPVIDVEESSGAAALPAVAPAAASQGAELACIVHTSGSSGPAKGVMIDHRALANLVANVTEPYALGADDRALHFGAFGWDSSIEEVILPLCKGASLLMRTDEADYGVPHFLRELAEQSVSHLYLPTSYWHEICLELSRGSVRLPKCVRSVLIGGEASSPADMAVWRARVAEDVDLWNCYGLTETCVTSTVHLDDRKRPVEGVAGMPLGLPCPSVVVAVLDEDMTAVPVGEAGELCIGGPGVARGYWDDPRATARAFVPDPHGTGRLYRTGDLVRQDPSGLLHYVGRVDRQAKVRGFRVNPGEVESALGLHPRVRRACVVPRTEPSGLTGLVAFLELVDDQDGTADISAFLESRLTDFMVPGTLEVLDRLPVLPNGKTDVTALMARHPRPRPAEPPASASASASGVGADLRDLWVQVLGIDSCGPEDDFLALGGNSLSGMRLAARINEAFGVELRLRDILDHRTVPALEELITKLRSTESQGD